MKIAIENVVERNYEEIKMFISKIRGKRLNDNIQSKSSLKKCFEKLCNKIKVEY